MRSDVRNLSIALAVIAALRGADYLTPRAVAGTGALSQIEAAAPLWVWSAGFLLGALGLGVGMLRSHRLVWAAHWLLAAIWTVFVIGFGLEYVQRPWLDGIRSIGTMALPAGLHLLLALRGGISPLTADESTSTEVISRDTGGGP